MTEEQLERRVRLLSVWASASTLLAVVLLVTAFGTDSVARWTEVYAEQSTVDTLHADYITAERVDIVEPDDTLALSLSNSERTPLPTVEGKKLRAAGDRNMPSIIFFDGHGDEVGGLIFRNTKTADGHTAGRHFSMDGYKQDQVLYLTHHSENGKKKTGLHIQDRPNVSIMKVISEVGLEPSSSRKELQKKMSRFRKKNPKRYQELWDSPKRVFVGRTRDGRSEVTLRDGNGDPRIRMAVDSTGAARLVFLDGDGNVTHRYPPAPTE